MSVISNDQPSKNKYKKRPFQKYICRSLYWYIRYCIFNRYNNNNFTNAINCFWLVVLVITHTPLDPTSSVIWYFFDLLIISKSFEHKFIWAPMVLLIKINDFSVWVLWTSRKAFMQLSINLLYFSFSLFEVYVSSLSSLINKYETVEQISKRDLSSCRWDFRFRELKAFWKYTTIY